ncbi:hypothetical protein PENSPDRAFT_92664 [Peniophora sp. CONT]|nr:hypothetical protein PENSPDRAFT_92664 [Peniophora sp. CONT]
MREAVLGDALPVAHAPGVTPFMTVESSPPLPSVSERSDSSEDWAREEANTKRAYRLCRIPNDGLQQQAPILNVPRADTTQSSIEPFPTSKPSDSAFGPGLLREISSLRQEVLVLHISLLLQLSISILAHLACLCVYLMYYVASSLFIIT